MEWVKSHGMAEAHAPGKARDLNIVSQLLFSQPLANTPANPFAKPCSDAARLCLIALDARRRIAPSLGARPWHQGSSSRPWHQVLAPELVTLAFAWPNGEHGRLAAMPFQFRPWNSNSTSPMAFKARPCAFNQALPLQARPRHSTQPLQRQAWPCHFTPALPFQAQPWPSK